MIAAGSASAGKFTQARVSAKLQCLQFLFYVNAIRLPSVTALILCALSDDCIDCLVDFEVTDSRLIKLRDVWRREVCGKRAWAYSLECEYLTGKLVSCFRFKTCVCRRCSLYWLMAKLLAHSFKDDINWRIRMISLLLKADVDYKLAQLIRVVLTALKRKWLFSVLDCGCVLRPLALLKWVLACESRIRRLKRLVVNDAKWLAAWIFKTCFQYTLDKPSIVRAGRLGLLISVNRFDFHSGFKFSTYARWWVKHRMFDALPNSAPTLALKTSVLRVCSMGVGCSASSTVSLVKADRYRMVSLDQTIGGNCDLHAITAYTDAAASVKCGGGVARAFKFLKRLTLLTPREERVLRLRGRVLVNRKWSLAKIGGELRLTKERVRQIAAAASAEVRSLNEAVVRRLLLS